MRLLRWLFGCRETDWSGAPLPLALRQLDPPERREPQPRTCACGVIHWHQTRETCASCAGLICGQADCGHSKTAEQATCRREACVAAHAKAQRRAEREAAAKLAPVLAMRRAKGGGG